MFVTVFLAILNVETGRLVYANAGHNPPYIVSPQGGLDRLTSGTDIALGIFEEVAYHVHENRLAAGEGLFVYSDGVTEAASESGQFFEEKRLETALGLISGGTSKNVTQGVTSALREFVGDAPQSDDITILHIIRTAHGH
jgi:sigma-B regulation protein RsbU (phosphoserine phosphatase)